MTAKHYPGNADITAYSAFAAATGLRHRKSRTMVQYLQRLFATFQFAGPAHNAAHFPADFLVWRGLASTATANPKKRTTRAARHAASTANCKPTASGGPYVSLVHKEEWCRARHAERPCPQDTERLQGMQFSEPAGKAHRRTHRILTHPRSPTYSANSDTGLARNPESTRRPSR